MLPRSVGLAAYAVALGVLSAIGWRLHVGVLDLVAGLQAMWGLGAWLAGRSSPRRRGRGAVAGAVFGAIALGSYYLTSALADGPHSAVSQLTSSGRFWVPAALLGGALFGWVGTWATERARGRWIEPSALSHAVMVAGLLAESAFVHDTRYGLGRPEALETATAFLIVIALVLAGVAWRRTGTRALLVAGALAAVLTPLARAAFLWLEHRYGYVTI